MAWGCVKHPIYNSWVQTRYSPERLSAAMPAKVGGYGPRRPGGNLQSKGEPASDPPMKSLGVWCSWARVSTEKPTRATQRRNLGFRALPPLAPLQRGEFWMGRFPHPLLEFRRWGLDL